MFTILYENLFTKKLKIFVKKFVFLKITTDLSGVITK